MTAALPAPRHPSPAAVGAGPGLPRPGRSRWQPLRTGLVDLFLYDTEEFHFKDGRLLLRGNNGTGKSKVLALTLPFLLDGDLSARRVEPDADPGKRMEWNLLLGGEHPHPERLGYTWIEFGRRDETTGEEHFRTLACGLKAVSGRGIVRHWFVVTDQRAGQGLAFLDATGTPCPATGSPRPSPATAWSTTRRAPTAGPWTRPCSASANSATPPWWTSSSSSASRSCPSAPTKPPCPRR